MENFGNFMLCSGNVQPNKPFELFETRLSTFRQESVRYQGFSHKTLSALQAILDARALGTKYGTQSTHDQ